ncbi:1-phosphatidylinositol 4,5-bisphosphate phosphodiesterase gamma-1-like [Amphibalanus amphitrite]|uniref:1-phosphatidylinositol 4,5-bisphosphate phosphodiesterase gamma-1-like n=1 Tax=Amphibalanus amphitrite TaxID=1232801 RepID=UPI001C91DAD4|nr:1-phosphatidylinositol 4,5-bisphosphate phosphodiesterase gamma-1-like [Amphibalanus amphitrite]XP_043208509.1 1-phosphatidylinositol 4,5-bisphosphate phosphodiesterase gamma-1-like [Amphibalanus amphitrite]XP_043208511.1 1-phosphatidylinositol 4,5-bisphosphate phosphodiesterase gamma-1-like [Amphibalanus amphitrite]XP_043208512.1 1-phosphatidylinositol 4,5-bisphosphate phosphodiesterase gamma-1-like [Amphibalanus amphitrite]
MGSEPPAVLRQCSAERGDAGLALEHTITLLGRGTAVTRFCLRRRPERKSLAVRRETGQLISLKASVPDRSRGDDSEVLLDLRLVKQVRRGRASREFERWPEDARRCEPAKCFVVSYGAAFTLKTLSVACLSERECDTWLRGLEALVREAQQTPYPSQVVRWLFKEFYGMGGSVTLKDLKAFLPRVNCKLSTARLKELFQEADGSKNGRITFDDFLRLYYRIVWDPAVLVGGVERYVRAEENVSVSAFCRFLVNEQQDRLGRDEALAGQFMRDYLQEPQRDVKEPFFTADEFVSFLFSKQNELWDMRNDTVTQDMTRPLAHYWIASSHNTYLTGDQFSSDSSVEAYARCLRAGCRCIELDCWDGPDATPLIFHGHTLTSKIKLVDVVRCIRDNAFVASEFPVILSIEDHCSLPQQRKMAAAFHEVFGDMLLTAPVDKTESELPSPQALRRKILIKHKKLPEGSDEVVVTSQDDGFDGLDLSDSLKNGILYLEDQVYGDWTPHFFVLANQRLYFTEEHSADQNDEDGEDSELLPPKANVPNDELHFGEKWFHGRLQGGRPRAEQLLREYSNLGNGTFLVRESETFVGDYSLSFWRNGQVNHCRIRTRPEWGQNKVYLIDTVTFDCLFNLINHYRTNPLRTQNFTMLLTEPVPQPNQHESKDWYHADCSRDKAEEMLQRVPQEGAFLVRPSQRDAAALSLSFRADRRIKHCRVRRDGRLYVIGNVQFESLVELVSYYEKHPLYKKVRLRYPVTSELVARAALEKNAPPTDGHASGTYMDPASFAAKVTVRALHDYRAQRDDELTFCKHAVITNVSKENDGWWRGDYGGRRQLWFPSNYVEEVEASDEADPSVLGSLQQGSVALLRAQVELLPAGPPSDGAPSLECIVRVLPATSLTPVDLGCANWSEGRDWEQRIRQVAESGQETGGARRDMERIKRIAKELSALIVYCRTETFQPERLRESRAFQEMSSFPETKVEKWLSPPNVKFFLWYNQLQLSRVYPKGQRIDSSNYNPVPMWNAGSQMVALNYQTPDRAMQLNQARFMQNGGCGYVLKPAFMHGESFDPFDKTTLPFPPTVYALRIIAGRHLSKQGRGIVSPFVDVEVIGAEYDNCNKYTTRVVPDNGLAPVWNETCEFTVHCPPLALLRFAVHDEDMFGDPNFIGQATYPLQCVRPGLRSVPLKNGYGEPLELASLLVHLEIRQTERPPPSVSQALEGLVLPSPDGGSVIAPLRAQ